MDDYSTLAGIRGWQLRDANIEISDLKDKLSKASIELASLRYEVLDLKNDDRMNKSAISDEKKRNKELIDKLNQQINSYNDLVRKVNEYKAWYENQFAIKNKKIEQLEQSVQQYKSIVQTPINPRTFWSRFYAPQKPNNTANDYSQDELVVKHIDRLFQEIDENLIVQDDYEFVLEFLRTVSSHEDFDQFKLS